MVFVFDDYCLVKPSIWVLFRSIFATFLCQLKTSVQHCVYLFTCSGYKMELLKFVFRAEIIFFDLLLIIILVIFIWSQ